MSLHNAAKYLESQGRGNDTMLVHMTPNEVRGLHALAKASGGQLSVNPQTGLTEAGWLDKLLPTIAGIGLSFIPGVGPLAAAGIVGGAETIRTGDLGKGIMAGLGAYGGAGLTQGLSTVGAKELASPDTMSGLATRDPIGAIGQGANVGDVVAANQTAAQPTMANVGAGLKQLGSTQGISDVWNAMPKYSGVATGLTLANATAPTPQGPKQEEEDPRYKKSPYYMTLSPDYKSINPLPTPNYYRPIGLGYSEGGNVEGFTPGGIAGQERGMYPQSQMDKTQYSVASQMPTSAEIIASDYEPKVNPYTGEEQYAAGGVTGYANEGRVRHLPRRAEMPDAGIFRDYDPDTSKKGAFEAAQILNQKAAAAAGLKAAKLPKTNVKGLGDISKFTTQIAEESGGGSIGGYSDGGRMLKGPGDGMSDSIPATIGKRQPARLADGEFVVPADVVSHLGNGSTDAGAKRLYAMMDKVRQARTGKKQQAKAIKADKYMPA